MAGVIGFGGAWVGAHATIVTQRDQARETRQAEARGIRAKTYSALLNTAGGYAIASLTLQDAIDRAPKDQCRSPRGKICGVLYKARSDWFKARSKFRNALDQVYIYGSSAGVKAARRLAATLPTTLNNEKGLVETYQVVNAAEFPDAYTAFLSVTCSEASPGPPTDLLMQGNVNGRLTLH